MNRYVGNLIVASTMCVILAGVILQWLVNEDETNSIMSTTTISGIEHPGIKNYRIEFVNKTILLRVVLSEPLVCNQIVDILGIDNLTVKGRTYIPVCKLDDPLSAVITYHEVQLI